MPPALEPSDDEEYASEEDSDFAPDEGAPTGQGEAAEEESSDEESAAEVASQGKEKGKPTTKRKRADAEEAEAAGFENSGDEAIIEKGMKRRRKKGKSGGAGEDEDEGGEGGLIKTRSMRAQEKVERKPLVNAASSTIDVDAIWASMVSGKPTPQTATPPATESTPRPLSPAAARSDARQPPPRSPSTTLGDGPDSMVMIKRTYNFAGKVHTEQKLVSRNSAEAKLYLASLPDPSSTAPPASEDADPSSSTKPKRPVKRARRSIFEPVSEIPPRADLHFGIRKDADGVLLIGRATGKERKLNTVEKSAMDWAGFVDKEGIQDELHAAGKSKGAYRARQEFLARIEEKKEVESRRARGLPV